MVNMILHTLLLGCFCILIKEKRLGFVRCIISEKRILLRTEQNRYFILGRIQST